jgi:L-fuculose-phosphate aldolase
MAIPVIQSQFQMAKTENELREDIVRVGRLVFEKGWVAANDGNISIRLDDERILCTPTATSKGMLHVDDLIIVDMQGNKIAGRKERTSEIMMHLTIYNLRPDVKSVVHAHPPVATGFATAGRSLNLALLPEVVITLGCVPLADYGLPGTPELTDPMLPLIPKYDALLMANHGSVCYGTDVWQAYFRMETVEHFARISLVAELLGGAKALPKVEVDKLIDSRTRYGVRTQVRAEPGCPVAMEDLQSGPAPATCGCGTTAKGSEKIEVTRDELIALVEEAIRARGLA